MKIPLIGFGTWELRGKECVQAVRSALEVGYRHIDTAFAYENHLEVAKAMDGWNRSEIFLTTKYMTDQVDLNAIEASIEKLCDQALRELSTDYLDLFLIHAPRHKLPMDRFLMAMYRLVEKGKIHFPGVSNFTIHHLQDEYDAGLKVPFNQVELHPYLTQNELVSFCEEHGTQIIAFRPFGKGKLLQKEPLFVEIGEKYGKTAAQIVLRWFLQKEIPVIPKAGSKEHMKENFEVFDFSLSLSEVSQIDALNRDHRYCDDEWAEFDY